MFQYVLKLWSRMKKLCLLLGLFVEESSQLKKLWGENLWLISFQLEAVDLTVDVV